MLVPLAQCFGINSLGDAPIVLRPACLGSHAVLVCVQFYGMDSLSACFGSHVVLVHVRFYGMDWAMHPSCPRAWARTLYLYSYRIFHGQPRWCTDRTMASVFGLARCTCTRTVFGMDSQGDSRSVQHLVWTAGVMHLSRDGPRAWTRTLYLYPYSIWHR